ncbi:MAG: hypothetical protein KDK27_11350 [Leptospiraceae bacterium]|nr:hypothetical protein [Leptospiraceae bacterium]
MCIATAISTANCIQAFPNDSDDLLSLLTALSSANNGSSISASPVNQVQSGLANLSATNSTNVTISTVDTSKAFSVCNFRTDIPQPQYVPICQLTSPTQLQISYQGACCTANVMVSWYVVEFSSGVSVQRGLQTIPGGTASQNIGLSTVNTGKTFALIEANANSTATNFDEQMTFTADINGSTNLLLTRNETGLPPQVAWQVIQMDGATVQAGATSITGVTSGSAALSSINVSKAFVVLSVAGAASNNGNDAAQMVRARLSSNNLALNRGAAGGAVDIHYYVVELDGNSNVQQGLTATPMASTLNMSASPGSSFNNLTAFPFITTTIDNAAQQFDKASYTVEFSGNQLNLNRAGNGVTSSVEWQVIELSN